MTRTPDGQILTFTNLFPSNRRPLHGCFVKDRMERVAKHSGLDWQVLCPVPRVPLLLRRVLGRADDRVLAAEPVRESVDGIIVHHVHYFHLPGVSLRRQARRIAKACLPKVRELSADRRTVLDAHYLYPDGVAAMMIAKELSLPCVLTARGTDVNVLAEQPEVREQMVDAFGEAAAMFAVSDALRGRFEDIVGDGKVETARNGVDLELFRPGDRDAARLRLGLPLDCDLVLGVGRLIGGKGFHHAAQALAARNDGSRLVLVGEGPDRERIAGLLPADRVHFLGSLDRAAVASAYQACDVFVLPSYREGWPNVVTEALACGRPVVASAVGGIPEILADPGVSRLVPAGDVEALGTAIADFLASPPDPVQARALADRYSWSATVVKLSDLFRRLLP
jgi:teichuronic acid biosynthesis glycosyltransferase TuaC